MSLFIPGEEHPKLIHGPSAHGWSGQQVLGHCLSEEPFRGHDRNLAGVDALLFHHAENPTEVVDVGVGVDHSGDWTRPKVLGNEFEGRPGRLGGGQRVDHHPPLVAADESCGRGVEASHLVNAVDRLIEAVLGVAAGLAPQ